MFDNLKKHREVKIYKLYRKINERYTRFVEARNGYRNPYFGSELESQIVLNNFGLQIKKAEQREKISNRVCYQPLFLGIFKKKKWLNLKLKANKNKEKQCTLCKQVRMIDNIYIVEKISRGYALVRKHNEFKKILGNASVRKYIEYEYKYKLIPNKNKKTKIGLNIIKFIK